VLSHDAHKAWNWNRGEAQAIRPACHHHARPGARDAAQPHLKVLVASGRYDLGTPYSATDWSLAQLDAPPEVRRASPTTTTTPAT
jgi:hypothetical protein